VPEFSIFARLRGHPERVCATCQLPLRAVLAVRDIDSNGDLADYHQACAPSIVGHVEAQRVRNERVRRFLP
jgi:hypothetical protein